MLTAPLQAFAWFCSFGLLPGTNGIKQAAGAL